MRKLMLFAAVLVWGCGGDAFGSSTSEQLTGGESGSGGDRCGRLCGEAGGAGGQGGTALSGGSGGSMQVDHGGAAGAENKGGTAGMLAGGAGGQGGSGGAGGGGGPAGAGSGGSSPAGASGAESGAGGAGGPAGQGGLGGAGQGGSSGAGGELAGGAGNAAGSQIAGQSGAGGEAGQAGSCDGGEVVAELVDQHPGSSGQCGEEQVAFGWGVSQIAGSWSPTLGPEGLMAAPGWTLGKGPGHYSCSKAEMACGACPGAKLAGCHLKQLCTFELPGADPAFVGQLLVKLELDLAPEGVSGMVGMELNASHKGEEPVAGCNYLFAVEGKAL